MGTVFSGDALHRINNTEYYVAVVRGADADGFIYTFHIWDNGTIDGVVDSWEYDTSDGIFGTLIQKPNTNLFVVAWRDGGVHGTFRTFRVWDNNGSIQKTVIDYAYTYNDDTNSISSRPAMLWMGDYLIVAADDDSTVDGWLYSYLVYDNGTISTGGVGSLGNPLDTEEFDNQYGRFANLELVDSDTILIQYTSNAAPLNTYLSLMTYNVTNGVFTDTPADTVVADNANHWLISDLEKIGPNTFCSIYPYESGDVWAKTFTVTDDGDISAAWVDTLEVVDSTNAGCFLSSFKVADPLVYGDGVLGVAFKGTDDDGFIATWNCTSIGVMPASRYDIIEYDTTLSYYFPSVVKLGNYGQNYAVLYDGNTKGYIKTISIESPIWVDQPPVLSNPTYNEEEVPITATYWNITVNDPEGNATTGTIEIRNSTVNFNTSWVTQPNGTFSVALTLNNNNNFTVYVNVTDNNGATNETYWFTTPYVSTFAFTATVNATNYVYINGTFSSVPHTYTYGIRIDSSCSIGLLEPGLFNVLVDTEYTFYSFQARRNMNYSVFVRFSNDSTPDFGFWNYFSTGWGTSYPFNYTIVNFTVSFVSGLTPGTFIDFSPCFCYDQNYTYWAWEFGDGGSVDGKFSGHRNPTHTYLIDWDYVPINYSNFTVTHTGYNDDFSCSYSYSVIISFVRPASVPEEYIEIPTDLILAMFGILIAIVLSWVVIDQLKTFGGKR